MQTANCTLVMASSNVLGSILGKSFSRTGRASSAKGMSTRAMKGTMRIISDAVRVNCGK